MTSISAGHIILTPTQPVGSGRPQQELNLGPPHQESRALPTELPRPSPRRRKTALNYHIRQLNPFSTTARIVTTLALMTHLHIQQNLLSHLGLVLRKMPSNKINHISQRAIYKILTQNEMLLPFGNNSKDGLYLNLRFWILPIISFVSVV